MKKFTMQLMAFLIALVQCVQYVRSVECGSWQFKCADGSKCISIPRVCDERVDCEDGSDEIIFDDTIHSDADGKSCQNKYRDRVCLVPHDYDTYRNCFKVEDCPPEWFICANGVQCAHRETFCDGHKYCRDGSDEILYNASIHTESDGIPCRGWEDLNRVCLLRSDVVDRGEFICNEEKKCLVGLFRCSDLNHCISKEDYCDGWPNCDDGSDEVTFDPAIHTKDDGLSCYIGEWESPNCLLPPGNHYLCDFHCTQDEYPCDDLRQCIPKTAVCDLKRDCKDGSDELLYDSSVLDSSKVQCRSKTKDDHMCQIPRSQNVSELCKQVECGQWQFKCADGSKCIPIPSVCDERVDCEDGSDEIIFDDTIHSDADGKSCQNKYRDRVCLVPHDYDTSRYCFNVENCLPEWFMCANGVQCAHRESFCDGIKYCRDGSDEILYNASIHTESDGISCRGWEDLNRVCLLHSGVVDRGEFICNKEIKCLVGLFRCSDLNHCISKEDYCDGWPNCDDGSDEITFDPAIHTKDDGLSCYIGEWDLPNCLLPPGNQYLCDLHCTQDEYPCDDLRQCIPKTAVCDLKRDCKDGSDELLYDSSILDSSKVQCRSKIKYDHICQIRESHNASELCNQDCDDDYFMCSDGSKCIHKHKFCDREKDCADGSDEIRYRKSKVGTPCRSWIFVYKRCILPEFQVDDEADLCNPKKNCGEGLFRCSNGRRCIPVSMFCDGVEHCSDGSDEVLYDELTHTKTDGVSCKKTGPRRCLIPSRYKSNTPEKVCPGDQDEA